MDKYERVALYLRGIERQFAEAAGEEGTPNRGVWVTSWAADLDVAMDIRLHEADVDIFASMADEYTDEELNNHNDKFKTDWV